MEGRASGVSLDNPLERERLLWRTYQLSDRTMLEQLIDPLALDVGLGGALGREAVLAAVAGMRIEGFAIKDLTARRVGDVEIVVYQSTVIGTYKGEPFPARRVHATTVWARAHDAWRVVHRHESPAR